MTISLQYFTIPVSDVDESLGFYRDGLGLGILQDVSSGGFRWLTLGSDDQPGLGIVLATPYAGRSEADGDAMQTLLTKGSMPNLVFRSDDLEGLFARLRDGGAEVIDEPKDQPWGPRDFAVRDPSGTMVRVAQA